MKKLYCFLILQAGLALTSCTVLVQKPAWLDAPEKACKKGELCAIGEGAGFNLASSDARAAIAKIFETKISATFKQSLASSGSFSAQDISSEIEEATEGVLNGIEIKKRYEGETSVYVLGVLNKRKAARAFRDKIKSIDERMKAMMKDGSARSVRQAEKLFLERELINSRYAFLKGGGIPAPISFEDIFRKKKARMSKVVVAIAIDAGEFEDVGRMIASSLVEQGYRIKDDKEDRTVTHVVQGTFGSEPRYMKVTGFEKFKFILDSYSIDKKGVKGGALQFTTVTTGRNLNQAAGKALIELEKYLKEHIADLNME